MNKKNLIFAGAIIVIAFVARLVPHVSNFSPLIAIALFSGAVFSQNKFYYLIPVSALILSDLFLGFHPLSPVIYFSLGLIAVFGMGLKKTFKMKSTKAQSGLLIKTTLAAVFFFLVTNLAVFFLTPLYPMTWAGLVDCYTMALPFFRSTLVSSLIYSFVLFNVYALATSKTNDLVQV